MSVPRQVGRSAASWSALMRHLAQFVGSERESSGRAGGEPQAGTAAQIRKQALEHQLDCELSAAELAEIEAHLAICRLLGAPTSRASRAVDARVRTGLGNDQLDRALREFRQRRPGEDPGLHAYEEVLALENSASRLRRGVFFTPAAVASFVVRAAHESLQQNFALSDGLADITTWRRMNNAHPGRAPLTEQHADEPMVRILDPAAGTGAFLVEVIDAIHRTLCSKWRSGDIHPSQWSRRWRAYVPRHLLPRLHGWELTPAACAVARFQIECKLRATGYQLSPDDTLHVRVRNSLMVADGDRRAANGLFSIVIGNPPYAGSSSRTHAHIQALLSEYKAGLDETNLNALSHDYVKFFALAHLLLRRAGAGLIGLVTNSSFLEGITHRRMRALFCHDFDRVRVVNLHGSVMRRTEQAAGVRDENVFDIQQGVAITLLSRTLPEQENRRKPTPSPLDRPASFDYRDLSGCRADKFAALRGDLSELKGSSQAPNAPHFFFRSAAPADLDEYARWPSLADVFESFSSGIKFRKDNLLIKRHFDRSSAEQMLDDVAALPRERLLEKYAFQETIDWRLTRMRPLFANRQPEDIVEVLYRPFDVRHAFYPLDRVNRLIPRGDSRVRLMTHMLKAPNIGLIFNRQIVGRTVSHFLVSRRPVSHGTFYLGNKGQDYFAPLYLHDGVVPRANLRLAFLDALRNVVGTPSPEAVLHYIYAILHSPTYRRRYDDALRTDYPRVALPGTRRLFEHLCCIGARLVSWHLMENDGAGIPPAGWRCERENGADVMVPPGYPTYEHQRINLSLHAWIGGVTQAAWQLEIGGYQVAHKWLRDRRGRMLRASDLHTYARIIAALTGTCRLMKQVDACIQRAGGWPRAFARAASK